MTNGVDLSRFTAPDVIRQIDVDKIEADIRSDLIRIAPELQSVLEAEGQVVTKLVQAAAYREVLVRASANDQAKGCLLAFAWAHTLDYIGQLVGAERRMIDPGDPDAFPPRPPVYESDEEFRARIPLTLERFTSAGTSAAYRALALEADGRVLDAQAVNPAPGVVHLYVLDRQGSGAADATLLDAVQEYFNEDRRPLCDDLTIRSAQITTFQVEARLTVRPGPDEALIVAAAEMDLRAYFERQRRLGYDVTRSMLYAAIGQEGVTNIELVSPAVDLVMSDGQAAYCDAISISVVGRDV